MSSLPVHDDRPVPPSLAAVLIMLAVALVVLGVCWWACGGDTAAGGEVEPVYEGRRKAQAAGHPSTIRNRNGRNLTRAQREEITRDVARALTDAGMKLSRPLAEHDVQVHARGDDGDYVVHTGHEYVQVQYRTNAGTQPLGQFVATYRAVQAVTTHAGVTRLY